MAIAACGLLLAACGDDDNGSGGGAGGNGGGANLSGNLAGAGASSQEAAMQAWIAGFQEQNPDVTVAYDPVGSGGGREQFVAGGVAFAGSDAALEEEELTKAQERCGGSDNLVEVPNYVSPIALIYNVEGVEGLQLSPETVARIFKGDIESWDDPAIKADNPDAELPGERITVVHRSDESGTTENFAEYMSATAPDVWDAEVSGDWPIEGQEAAQGTSGVVDAVKNGQGTIGYADRSQAGDLGVAKVKVGEEFVEPAPEAAARILEASEESKDPGRHVFTYEIDRETQEAGVYPIVLVSYLIGCTKYDKQSDAQLVKGLFSYIISPDGQQKAAEGAGSAPLAESLRTKVQPSVDAIGSGT
jgi:phosphate transport system substrate-binding protein